MRIFAPIRKTFRHKKMGQLRVIYDGKDLFFCIRDISRILGYGEQGKKVRKYAFHIQKYNYGWLTLHFMNDEDVSYMMLFEKSPKASELHEWMCGEIAPDMIRGDLLKEDDEIDDGNEEPYIIYRRDYDKLIYSLMTACHHLTLLCDSVNAYVPIERPYTHLYETLNVAEKACSDVLEMYNILWFDMRAEITDTTLSQFDQYAVPAEKEGFVPECLLENRWKRMMEETSEAEADSFCDLTDV